MENICNVCNVNAFNFNDISLIKIARGSANKSILMNLFAIVMDYTV